MDNTLSLAEIARRIGVRPETVWRWMRDARHAAIAPRYRFPTLTLYSPDDVITWLKSVQGGKYVERFRKAVTGA